MTEISKTPALRQCTPESFMGAIMHAAQLGLEIGSAFGHAYLIPYGQQAQLIVGWRGLLDLARRSGELKSLSAHVVYEKDEFDYGYGDTEFITHKPTKDSKPGTITYAYAVAHLRDGSIVREVMSRDQIDAIRTRGRTNKVWDTDFPEMARKTVVRRIMKYLPLAAEVRDVLERETEQEFPKPVHEPEKYKALIAEAEPAMSPPEVERKIAVAALQAAWAKNPNSFKILGSQLDGICELWSVEQLFNAVDRLRQ